TVVCVEMEWRKLRARRGAREPATRGGLSVRRAVGGDRTTKYGDANCATTGRAGGGPAGPRSPIFRGARTIEPRDAGLRHRRPAAATAPAEPPPALPVDSVIRRPELRVRDIAHDPHLLDKGGATA